MNDTLIKFRNKITHWLYKTFFKPFFFAHDPELIHDKIIRFGVFLGKTTIGKWFTRALFSYKNPILQQEILGISFQNPVGLSAGFDKNAQLTDILPEVGFGFAELGSITGAPCSGNEGKRLWRLPKSKGLVVYYGLKNDGAKNISKRLSSKVFTIPMGISVAAANSKDTIDTTNAIQDMISAFEYMKSVGSYITVNISCPNTQTGQPFLVPENLEKLFTTIDAIQTNKPIFIKLSPDTEFTQLDALLDIARRHRIHGIICSNLTKDRNNPKIFETVPRVGGMSGKIVQDRADALLSYIYQKERSRFVLIGCGGVFSAEDAYHKIRQGASLVQMITGMIFEGPQVVSAINHRLAQLLKRDGFIHISQAIGADYRYE